MRVFSRLVCVVLVVALHAAVVLAGWDRREAVNVNAPILDHSRLPLRVTFIDESNKKSGTYFGPVTQGGLELQSFKMEIEPPDITPLLSDSFEPSAVIASLGDVRKAEELQSIYSGQILARLNRIASAELQLVARCVINVVQDELGNVLDVRTNDCEASADQKTNIATLLRAASPLPLPPQGLAKGSYLTLDLSK